MKRILGIALASVLMLGTMGMTALAEEKVNVKTIQKQVGHSSESTTLKIYTHTTERMENELVEILDKVFIY